MKTGMAILLISFILLFTGCGTQAGTETGSSFSSEEQREIPPGEVEALAFLDKLAENKVTPNGRAQGDFKIKYPQWFDKNDKIIYPSFDELRKAKTNEEVDELCQIPEEIVNTANTKTLLRAVEGYPKLSVYHHFDSFAVGLQRLVEVFYGMNVLLRREDACRAAAESYLSRNLKALPEGYDDFQMLEALLLEEFLISREDAYYKFSEEERREILEAVEKNYDAELKLADGSLRTHFYDMAAYGDNPWKSELP